MPFKTISVSLKLNELILQTLSFNRKRNFILDMELNIVLESNRNLKLSSQNNS